MGAFSSRRVWGQEQFHKYKECTDSCFAASVVSRSFCVCLCAGGWVWGAYSGALGIGKVTGVVYFYMVLEGYYASFFFCE